MIFLKKFADKLYKNTCFFFKLKVTVGFTTAAALTIGSSQIKALLGIKGRTDGFIQSWWSVFEQINETKLWDTLLGVSTMIILLLLKVMSRLEQIITQKHK